MSERWDLEEMTDEALERIIRIIGPNSAARQALVSRETRRAAGQNDATIYWDRRGAKYLVGPKIKVSHP